MREIQETQRARPNLWHCFSRWEPACCLQGCSAPSKKLLLRLGHDRRQRGILKRRAERLSAPASGGLRKGGHAPVAA